MMQVTLPFAVGRSEGVHHMGQEPTLGNREKSQRQVAREHLVTAMSEGHSWQQVSAGAAVPLKRAMAYRLMDIRRSCVERHEPFSKNSVGKLLIYRVPLSRQNYTSNLV